MFENVRMIGYHPQLALVAKETIEDNYEERIVRRLMELSKSVALVDA